MSPRLRSRPDDPRRQSHRDQSESAFARILGCLVDSLAGARGAALVDSEGETVDYAGQAPPFDIRLAAAHLRIVLRQADAQRQLAGLKWVVVRAERKSYVVHELPEGYALVVLMTKTAAFVGWHRSVAECARALAVEAGWTAPPLTSLDWFRVEVVADSKHRPRSVVLAARVEHVEILGALVRSPRQTRRATDGRALRRASQRPGGPERRESLAGTLRLAPLERGWRVRLDNGLEATLVREPGGVWYSDEPLDE